MHIVLYLSASAICRMVTKSNYQITSGFCTMHAEKYFSFTDIENSFR